MQRIRLPIYRTVMIMITLTICVGALGASSCSDKYKTAAKASGQINDDVDLARQAVKEAVTSNIITPEDGIAVNIKLLDVTRTNKAFNATLKTIAAAQKNDPNYKPNVKTLFDPVSKSIGQLEDNGTFGIKSATGQAWFKTWFDRIVKSMNIILALSF